MTYQEAEQLLNTHLPTFQQTGYFDISGSVARFLGLFIAPADSSKETKQRIYDECILNAYPNKSFILDNNLWGRPMQVFLAYLQKGHPLVIAWDDYLRSSEEPPHQ